MYQFIQVGTEEAQYTVQLYKFDKSNTSLGSRNSVSLNSDHTIAPSRLACEQQTDPVFL